MNRYDRTIDGIRAKARADAVAGTRRMYGRTDEEREQLRQLDMQIAGQPQVVLTAAQQAELVEEARRVVAKIRAEGEGR